MFYMQYLSSLCQRRQWPEPLYEPHVSRSGVKCVVRVNHREYHTDRTYASEVLATENAAMRAYLICRNFSVNNGRYPSGRGSTSAGGVLQGMPVAIGTGRRATVSEESDGSSVGSGSRSGGSSPGSAEFPISYRERREGGSRGEPRRQQGRVLEYGPSRRR